MSLNMLLTLNAAVLTKQIESQIEKRMMTAAMIVTGEVKRLLAGPRSGRFYRVPGTKRTYRASAPGEAPAVRLGALRQKYEFGVEGKGVNAVGVVGNPLKYAVYLEKGTHKMAPRPHLSVAFRNTQKQIEQLFADLV